MSEDTTYSGLRYFLLQVVRNLHVCCANNSFSLKGLSANHIRIMAFFADDDTALRLDLLVSSSSRPATTSVRVISVTYIRFRALVAVLDEQCYDKDECIELFKLLDL